MQRLKVYEDMGNIITDLKPQQNERKRYVLGEIKNTIITRSKYSELNKDFKRIHINDQVKRNTKRFILKKKPIGKREETEAETKKSPQIIRNRRLSSLFRVSEYANDIYKYLQRIEEKYPISNSVRLESIFGEKNRFALVDWLVDINEHFQFVHETLQLCVSIVDRYLQEQDSLNKKEMELIALAAVFIASKYEELVPIELLDLLRMSCCSSSIEEVLDMEMKIARKLQYSFGKPVAAHFVRRYSNVAHATGLEQSCAFYLTDVALMSSKLSLYKPSIIAASALSIALFVSNGTVDRSLWNQTLIKYSTYKIKDLEECIKELAECQKKAKLSKYQAIEKKYSKVMHFSVTQITGLQIVIEALAM
ncbi:G2/mitotic-specific cyclin-B [Halyomorpha halys]|uniref:G2/mitotic-specific cyclin-B n=1 Tax=Halyomorpha halys TaxID=286706 RepID=UPI0006D522C2|nr:G2/mitotic-specific cyclin-B-like [Halyomorpha halys]